MIVTSSCSPLRRIARASNEVWARTRWRRGGGARSSQVPSGQVEEDVLEGAAPDGQPGGQRALRGEPGGERGDRVGVDGAGDGVGAVARLGDDEAPRRARRAGRARAWSRAAGSGPRPRRRATRTEPCAMTRPWSTTTTWSARSSASSIRCVVSTTATPSSRSSRTRSQTACRVCGSMPALGSSRNTTSGRPTIAAASASRWRWPPESRRTVVPANDAEPEALGELAQVPRVGVHPGDVREHLVRLDARRQAAVLQHHAHARAQRRGPASTGSRPEHAHACRRRAPAGPRSTRPSSSCRRRWARGPRSPGRGGRRGRARRRRLGRRSA